jgi:hypothetical protein
VYAVTVSFVLVGFAQWPIQTTVGFPASITGCCIKTGVHLFLCVRQLKTQQQLFVVFFFAIFGMIKLIRNSKSAGAMRVIFSCIVRYFV